RQPCVGERRSRREKKELNPPETRFLILRLQLVESLGLGVTPEIICLLLRTEIHIDSGHGGNCRFCESRGGFDYSGNCGEVASASAAMETGVHADLRTVVPALGRSARVFG